MTVTTTLLSANIIFKKTNPDMLKEFLQLFPEFDSNIYVSPRIFHEKAITKKWLFSDTKYLIKSKNKLQFKCKSGVF